MTSNKLLGGKNRESKIAYSYSLMRESGSPSPPRPPAYPARSAHPLRHRRRTRHSTRHGGVCNRNSHRARSPRLAPPPRPRAARTLTKGCRRQPLDKGAERACHGAAAVAGIKAKEKKIIKFVRARPSATPQPHGKSGRPRASPPRPRVPTLPGLQAAAHVPPLKNLIRFNTLL